MWLVLCAIVVILVFICIQGKSENFKGGRGGHRGGGGHRSGGGMRSLGGGGRRGGGRTGRGRHGGGHRRGRHHRGRRHRGRQWHHQGFGGRGYYNWPLYGGYAPYGYDSCYYVDPLVPCTLGYSRYDDGYGGSLCC